MVKLMDRPAFGKLLREFRVAAGLSQEALAERARMSVDGIGSLERGINRAPQRETLALLIDALELQPDERQAIEAAASRPSRPRTGARAARRHNLPRPLTPLFGRERDVAMIEDLLATSRVLTLSGAGGVGKTRLAIDAGLAALECYAAGVWFVDLVPEHDADGILAAIATVLSVRDHPDRVLIDATAQAIGREKLLLILDNCEHVAAAAAVTVQSLMHACPELRILATSRQPLHIAGEQTYRVASLNERAALELFVDAAQRADASFILDREDRPIAARIGMRLDGIALAIELAAARVKVLGLEQIEELLAERFRVLTGTGRLERHRTMLAVVDWSYELLSAQERLLFERLGVFAADFSLDAALVVCSGDGIEKPMALDLLGSLVDKSLVASERHARTNRFRLLETMRAYALEKLAESAAVYRHRHAEYYLEVARRTVSARPSALALETEYENLRQALDWTIDAGGDLALGIRLLAELREFLLLRGFVAESARRAERALQAGSALLTPALQAMAWETLAAMRGDLLLPEKTFEAVNRAIDLYEQLGDYASFARVLRVRGVANLRFGSFVAAEEDLRRGLALSKAYGDRRELAMVLGSIAVSYEMTGRIEEGRKTTLEVLEMARADGDERIFSVSMMNLAEAQFALGEPEGAVATLRELLATRMLRKNLRMRANTESNLAAYLIALNRTSEAQAMARAAVTNARDAGDTGIMSCALGHLAAILVNHDAPGAAKLIGYVDRVFAGRYHRENTERFTHDLTMKALRERLSEEEIGEFIRAGAAMNEGQAVRLATRAH